MTLRLLLAFVLSTVATLAQAQAQWLRLDSVAADDIPMGVWRQMPAGALFKIERVSGHKDVFRLTLLYSEDLTIKPGTEFGTMRATAVRGTYDASLLADPRKPGAASKRRSFTIEVDPEAGRLCFKHYKKHFTVNFTRMLPYLVRFSVRREDTRPEGIDGAVRIAPESYGEVIIL